MAIPVNGYLGDPNRTTAEFQDGIDDLTEALNDPATGLDAKAASADVYDKTEVYKKTESDSRYVNTSGDTMTGQLNGITPSSNANLTRKDYVDDRVLNKNWVSKFTGVSTSLPNTWGNGLYLIDMDFVVLTIEVTGLESGGREGGASYIDTSGNIWTAYTEGGGFRAMLSPFGGGPNSPRTITQLWKSE